MKAAANGDTSLVPRNREEVLLNRIAEAVKTGRGGSSKFPNASLHDHTVLAFVNVADKESVSNGSPFRIINTEIIVIPTCIDDMYNMDVACLNSLDMSIRWGRLKLSNSNLTGFFSEIGDSSSTPVDPSSLPTATTESLEAVEIQLDQSTVNTLSNAFSAMYDASKTELAVPDQNKASVLASVLTANGDGKLAIIKLANGWEFRQDSIGSVKFTFSYAESGEDSVEFGEETIYICPGNSADMYFIATKTTQVDIYDSGGSR